MREIMKMRRQKLNLTVLALILALTLSFLAIPMARGQNTATIIGKLETLRGRVKDEHPALENKVNAVIHQIEAGAFTGAVNKLENDVKKSLEAWVENPEELIELVDEIIDLIKGITPPPPITPDFEITADPEKLNITQGGWETSNITITSLNGFNKSVDLTVSPESIEGVLKASINQSQVMPPANGSVTSTLNVTVYLNAKPSEYDITVTGIRGSLRHNVTIKVVVTALENDTTPPKVVKVLRNPETPAYNESVTVTAFVFDAGGVKQVILNYSAGAEWTAVDMTLNEGLYQANIPAFPFNSTVEYRVFALDNANNPAPPSSLYSYKVIDPYPPLLRIDSPAQRSYLSGTVAITVFMKDQNSGGESGFGGAELSINGTVVKTWEPPAASTPITYNWNTMTFGPDGVYIVKLRVHDKAGNVVEKSLTVVVDNTLPSAVINVPVQESYVRLSVLIKVTGNDVNFDKMEVRIDDEVIRTSTTSGSEVLEWNTRNYDDGVHSITLTVYDKAGNIKQALVNVTVDNTPPSIGAPSWSPKEPLASVDIQINVTVSEPTYGSGIENVTLWFKNKTIEEWRFIPMTFNGNWTAILSNQSDTNVRFYIEAYDKAGNFAKSEKKEFTVAAPPGFPLAWILAAIAIIGASGGGATYYVRRRRKKGAAASAVPSSSV